MFISVPFSILLMKFIPDSELLICENRLFVKVFESEQLTKNCNDNIERKRYRCFEFIVFRRKFYVSFDVLKLKKLNVISSVRACFLIGSTVNCCTTKHYKKTKRVIFITLFITKSK